MDTEGRGQGDGMNWAVRFDTNTMGKTDRWWEPAVYPGSSAECSMVT